jgi:hypothetical protein
VALGLLATGCKKASPADRYLAFAAAARNGDSAAVWSMLSARSREALDARARAVAATAPGVVPGSGAALVVGDLAVRASKVRSALTVRESADAAVVRVEDEAGRVGEVSLVREGGAWKVVVPPDALAGP